MSEENKKPIISGPIQTSTVSTNQPESQIRYGLGGVFGQPQNASSYGRLVIDPLVKPYYLDNSISINPYYYGSLQHVGLQIENDLKLNELNKEVLLLREKLRKEILNFRTAQQESAQSLEKEREKAAQIERQKNDIQQRNKELLEKESLSHLLNRICDKAKSHLLKAPSFQKEFFQELPCQAFVMSIDVRRSTELMLKSKSPKSFAEFILTLANRLRDIVLSNYGVFDKFTGDGILASFPSFYSGEDAGYYAIKAGLECHNFFREHYRNSRGHFNSVLLDVGLGIGIDYGLVQMVQVGGETTVVGNPVVYSCRMGGGEAGKTYLNQPAYDELFNKYSEFCDFEEVEIHIKHEGLTLAYSIKRNEKSYKPKLPSWLPKEEDEAQ